MNWAFKFVISFMLLEYGTATYASADEVVPELSAQISGTVQKIDLLIELSSDLGPDHVYWDWEYEVLGSQFIILNFSKFDVALLDVGRFEILSADGQVQEEILFDTLNVDEPSVFIFGQYARIRLHLDKIVEGTEVNLESVAYERESGASFSIVLPDEREHIVKVTDPNIKKASAAVAQVIIENVDKTGYCTGFLIANDLMITNEHCVNSQHACNRTHVVFGRQLVASGKLKKGEAFRCAELLASNYEADAALLRIVGSPGAKYGFLELASRGPKGNSASIVIGHPGGQPKQVSRKGCQVGRASVWGRTFGIDFQHSCDVLGGSSGSPVLSKDFEVVGLHHFGFGDVPSATRWNKAVKIDRVAKKLKLSQFID